MRSRYQDSTYRDGAPQAWRVKIVRGGKYRLTFRRNEVKGKGALHISWRGRNSQYPLADGKVTIEHRLAKGDGILLVWFEDARGRRIALRNNSTTGDVQLLRVE